MSRKPLQVRIGDVTKDNFNQLRKLNQVVFPVRYSESFYTNIQHPDVAPITKLAWHSDVVVGGICCRFEAAAPSPATAASAEATEEKNNKPAAASTASGSEKRIYIMTLGVLAPYRGRGIGSTLLRQIVEYAESHADVAEVFLHVQTCNEEALTFYKRHGFEIVSKIDNYYKKLDPPDCYVVSKKFVHVK